MQWTYFEIRRRLVRASLWPEGRMARIASYLLGLAAVLYLLQKVLGWLAPAWGEHLDGWVDFLAFIAAVLFSILAFRWLKKRILWRLRNRLIVTYIFIGVIPVVLVATMGFVTVIGFAAQFASFLVNSEIGAELRSLEAGNSAIANELAAHIEKGDIPVAGSVTGLKKRNREWQWRHMCAWYDGKPLRPCDAEGAAMMPPGFAITRFRDIARDSNGLHLRAATSIPIESKTLTVVTSEPFDKGLLGDIAADFGEITLYASGFSLQTGSPEKGGVKQSADTLSSSPNSGKPNAETNGGIVIHENKGGTSVQADQQLLLPTFSVGTVPEPVAGWDREVPFAGAPLRVVDWRTGESASAGALLHVRTRPSVLYGRLFAALGDFAKGVEYILVGVGIFFAIIELIALFTGTRMTRTVTRAVAQIYDATKNVDRGDFSHRIPVQSHDQLAELALSFNSMTESIEKLILEQKEKQRLENELAIAQEVQAQLFPRQVSELESLEVHGFCRPARTVSGDYYDFLTASSNKLILAVGDISGKGISAALLMATIHSAVRAYSVESLPQMREPVAVGAVAGAGRVMAAWPEGVEVSPGALLALLNHQLYESTPPEKYATLFLGIYDGRSHRLTYSNGGHLPPILIGEDGAIRKLESGGTVIGLFDNMTYDEGRVEMKPGEIFLAYSDGVTEPENDFGEFGEERLIDLVRENRRLPLAQISQTVTMAVDDWIGDKEQPDDVTLVLARAR
jgi:sigma-B regulation protein RsbU (phosphoserine phosphatase)